MTLADDNLAQLFQGSKQSPYRVRAVASISDARRVNLDVGNGLTVEVPCLASYVDRTPGDQVLVIMTDRGWLVLGKIAWPDDEAPPPATDTDIP